MEIIKLNNKNIDSIISKASVVLRDGGIVIYPTETCYGIGVDATNQEAVDKVLKYKSRREGKPLSMAVINLEMAREYVEVNDTALNLYENFLPGPLTVVSKSLGKVANGVESELGTIGIRVPDYPLILEIVKKLGKPVTSTSANASYKKRPYKIQDILDCISNKQKALIDLIVDAGELPKNDPSTVVDTTLNEKQVLRQGGIKMTKKQETRVQSPEETRKVGFDLMKRYIQHLGYKSIVFAMKGELGVGKTEMTKGIAKSLAITEVISSPTYIIEAEYDIPAVSKSYLSTRKTELYHLDVWRLFESKELEELDFYKKIDESHVFVIEWADKIMDVLENIKAEAIVLWVEIDYGQRECDRVIRVSDFA